MKKTITTTVAALALTLAGCGATEPEPATSASSTASTTATSSTTSSATTTTATTTTEAAPAPAKVEQSTAEAEQATPIPVTPTFVACWEDEAAQMSDGSIVYDPINCDMPDPFANEGWHSSPDNPALAEYYAEQERLANIPYADGGTCPAYKCGYGTNDQGQRNPTSGEIQTLDGCQEGYITDPQLCKAVAWAETHQADSRGRCNTGG